MALTRREEDRALDADERELVAKSHHPEVQELSDSELSDVVRRVRERRNRARSEADRRRREMRGKSAPKGAAASADDSGSRTKLLVLSTAMRRLNSETKRRRQMGNSLTENARRALALKQEAEAADEGADFNTRTAHKGMRKVASERRKNLIRPMELGRQRKAGSVAQAKRDSR